MRKKILFRLFIICLITFYINTATSQSIFLVDDSKFAIIYLKPEGKVRIKTKFLEESSSMTYDNYIDYYLRGDTVKQIMGAITPDSLSIFYNSKNDSVYQHFPFYIPIKNNKYLISKVNSDSLFYDLDSKIVGGRNLGIGVLSDFRIIYYGKTQILNAYPAKCPTDFILIDLDNKNNIISMMHGKIDSCKFDEMNGINSIQFYDLTLFNYDKKKNKVVSIQQFHFVEGYKHLVSTQLFIYKKGRPVKSFERNEETGKVEYQQIYNYSKESKVVN
jgi:hypothetical protein